MNFLAKVFIIFTFIIVNVNQAFPQDSPFESQDIDKQIEEEMRWLQAETYVITASRVLENIKKICCFHYRDHRQTDTADGGKASYGCVADGSGDELLLWE